MRDFAYYDDIDARALFYCLSANYAAPLYIMALRRADVVF